MSADHEALRALGQRYARAVDGRDIEALAALFAPDAIIDGARGRMGRAEWLEAMAAPAAFPTSMHLLGDPLIEIDPQAGSGRLDTYAVVYQIADSCSGQKDLTLGIRYLDQVERGPNGWLIKERVARTVWVR